MEVPTLAIVCHEGHPPADDTFAYPGCPQPAPARSPRPGPGPAGETRSPAPTGGLLAIGIAAVIAGSRSFAAIGQRAADADEEVLAGPGAARGPAEESTFRRAFALVSPDLLDRVPDAWLHTRAVQAGGRLVIAIDGKTSAAPRTRTGRPRTWSQR